MLQFSIHLGLLFITLASLKLHTKNNACMFIQLTGTVTHNIIVLIESDIKYTQPCLTTAVNPTRIYQLHAFVIILHCSYFHYYTVSRKIMHQLWNGITQNYKDWFWCHLAEIFKILYFEFFSFYVGLLVVKLLSLKLHTENNTCTFIQLAGTVTHNFCHFRDEYQIIKTEFAVMHWWVHYIFFYVLLLRRNKRWMDI